MLKMCFKVNGRLFWGPQTLPSFLIHVHAFWEVFCRAQLVSLDWHHLWAGHLQLHRGRPALPVGTLQEAAQCKAWLGRLKGAVTHWRKVQSCRTDVGSCFGCLWVENTTCISLSISNHVFRLCCVCFVLSSIATCLESVTLRVGGKQREVIAAQYHRIISIFFILKKKKCSVIYHGSETQEAKVLKGELVF